MVQDKDAQTYQSFKYKFYFLRLLIDLVVLSFVFYSGFTLTIKSFATAQVSQIYFVNGLYMLILSCMLFVIHFPLNFYKEFVLEHEYNLSNQTFFPWFLDEIKKSILGLLLAGILVIVIYSLLAKFPNVWWVYSAGFWLFLSFVMAKLLPTVIIPMFYKYEQIENQSLKDKIKELFTRCNISLKDVYSINFSSKTKKANAFICGIGNSRRVVLSDTLIEQFTDGEIETVIAHELGHHKNKDIVKNLFLSTIVIGVSFFMIDKVLDFSVQKYNLSGIDDIALLPLALVAFTLINLIITPLMNAYSCFIERKADQFSLELTKNPKDFITMITKLGQKNLSEFQPNKLVELFFYDHPPIANRIQAANQFKVSV